MFGFLKDKLKKSVDRLAEKVKEGEAAAKKPAAKAKKPAEKAKPAEKKPTKPKKEKPKPIPEPAMGHEATEPHPIPEPIPEPIIEPEPETGMPTGEPKPEKEEKKDGFAQESEAVQPVKEKKPGFFGKIRGIRETVTEKVTEKTLTEADIDSFFNETETDLLQANIAVEAIEYMRASMKKELAQKRIKRMGAEQFIKAALEAALLGLVSHGTADMEAVIKKAKSEGRAACFVFLGYNGAGKTTSIAKVARYLLDKGHSVVLAAGDTFRAASIEQLEYHGQKLGVRVIKHSYGADSAAVIFDARKHAESKGIDVVLADTAGRMHTDKNLADELKKIVRVNEPDMKILLVDSLTGNDAVEQAKMFHGMAGVDAVIMAKTDVNEKGGSILSVSYAIRKPILFLGTGQEYGDLKEFDPKLFVKGLLE